MTDIRTIFQSSCDTAPLASKVSSENLVECETFDFVNDTQSQVRGCYNTQSVQPKATHVVQNVKQKQISTTALQRQQSCCVCHHLFF